jgi:hypothetical protein
MKRFVTVLTLLIALCVALVCPVVAQGDDSPTSIVKKFYQQLHARKYLEGFSLSVYSPAVETLSPDEVRELEPEFTRIAAGIPESIETSGEQISGETATVFIKMPGVPQPQEITLVKIDGRWRVGDKDTWKLAKRQGRDFFFNARISVSENEAVDWLDEIFGAETIYLRAKSQFTTLEELIKLGGVSQQLAESGYRFELKLSDEGKSFSVTAVPAQYGHTGRRSFFIDQTGVMRVEDRKGQPATASSPRHQPGK